jgi:Zinc knuckle
LSKRNIMAKLATMKLTQEPGENVDKFATKVLLILDQLKGMSNKLPADLGAVTIAPFMSCSTSAFKTKANMVHEEVALKWSKKKDPEMLVTHILDFVRKYQVLKQQNLWDAYKVQAKQEDMMTLKAENKGLNKQLQQSTARGATSYGSGARCGNSMDTRTCYKCGKVGHIAPNCPQKEAGANPGT